MCTNIRIAIEERFWGKVDTSGECWEWTAYKDKDGYGTFWFQKISQRAHRVIWTLEKGEIPKGMCVLHKCDNPPCVRIDHLFLGTKADNMKDRDQKDRNYHAKKTHCINGHSFSGANLYINPNSGRRICRACHKKWDKIRNTTQIRKILKKQYNRQYRLKIKQKG